MVISKSTKERKAPKDLITQKIGVLNRRETEARILLPFLEKLFESFDRQVVLTILANTVKELARKQGKDLSCDYGNDIEAFIETLEFWKQDGALEIDVLEKSDTKLNFNVTRCKYAEFYKAMGMEDLGTILSCNRDFAMIEGFNEKAKLKREKTILSGSSCCTFRYEFGGD